MDILSSSAGGGNGPGSTSSDGSKSQATPATDSKPSEKPPVPENPPTSSGAITEEHIQAAIDSLDNEFQRDFIRKCLNKDPKERPTSLELLFHPVIFEVHSLKLLAAHVLVNSAGTTILAPRRPKERLA